MKTVKKLLALILAITLVATLSACHPKDEKALSLDDINITSSVYLLCLINAESEARSKVEANATENEITLTTDEDYYKQNIDGKTFEEWTKETALELCKEYVVLENLLKDKKYKFSEEDIAEAKETAKYYWESYGMSALYEANSISYASYEQTVIYSYMADAYFLSVYGEGGEKEVSAKDIKKGVNDNYVLVRRLDGEISSEMNETQVASLKTEFKGYLSDLKSGKIKFEKLYKKYNNITDEQIKQTLESSGDEIPPKDIYATVVGGSKTSNPDENFVAMKSMKQGEIKFFEYEGSSYSVVIKKDINKDSYYYNGLKDSVLHILKDEEHAENLKKLAKKAEVKVNDFAVNRFKLKDIVTESDLSAQYAQ